MFLELVVRHDVHLPPQHAGASIFERIRETATEAMLQHCSLGYGKVLAVLEVQPPKPEEILVGRDSQEGRLTCPTMCRVVTQQMYVGEVVDVVVMHVSKIGLFATAGAMIAFVAVTMMPPEFRFETPPNRMTNGRQSVMPGAVLRVRVKGMRQMSNDQYLIASFNEDYMGVIDAPEGDVAAAAPPPPQQAAAPPAAAPPKPVPNQTIAAFFNV